MLYDGFIYSFWPLNFGLKLTIVPLSCLPIALSTI